MKDRARISCTVRSELRGSQCLRALGIELRNRVAEKIDVERTYPCAGESRRSRHAPSRRQARRMATNRGRPTSTDGDGHCSTGRTRHRRLNDWQLDFQQFQQPAVRPHGALPLVAGSTRRGRTEHRSRTVRTTTRLRTPDAANEGRDVRRGAREAACTGAPQSYASLRYRSGASSFSARRYTPRLKNTTSRVGCQ